VSDITTYCPYCENQIVLPEEEIIKSIRFRNKAHGKALIGCPNCFHVMVMPAPEDLTEVEKWIGLIDEKSFVCIPFLDSTILRIPAGWINIAGTIKYRTGDGNLLLDRREYMLQYGVDPYLYYKAHPGPKPFVVG
jgi:hypothetical protein